MVKLCLSDAFLKKFTESKAYSLIYIILRFITIYIIKRLFRDLEACWLFIRNRGMDACLRAARLTREQIDVLCGNETVETTMHGYID